MKDVNVLKVREHEAMADCRSCGKNIIWPSKNPALTYLFPICPMCKLKNFSGNSFMYGEYSINLFFIDFLNGAVENPHVDCGIKIETWGDYIKLCEPCKYRTQCWNQANAVNDNPKLLEVT